MARDDVQPLRAILHRALVRYLTVRPGGFELDRGERLRPVVEARILGFGGARTFYQSRKPVCRSLDGLRPVTGDTNRTCRECEARPRCGAPWGQAHPSTAMRAAETTDALRSRPGAAGRS